jgi:hypothetical protein
VVMPYELGELWCSNPLLVGIGGETGRRLAI